MLSFLRSDLSQIRAYTPHPGSAEHSPPLPITELDRVDTNESPYDLPDELKQKLGWTYHQLMETNRYPDGSHVALRQAIAEYVNESAALYSPVMSAFGGVADIKAANISVGNGSDELIRSVLIATCLGGEGSILVANPTFSMYGILAQTLGIPAMSVERSQSNFEIDLPAAQLAIQQTQNPPVRVVFVVHPNSPTANALTPTELDWLRSLPENILVVIDEAYFEFSQTTVVGELHQRPNWIVLRTFSKAFRLAALRVGYAIAHPELIAALEKIRLPYNLPSFSSTAAQLVLAHRQQLLASIAETLAERDRLKSGIEQLPALQLWPSDSNFLYLRLKTTAVETIDSALAQLSQQLKASGTLVRHTGGGLRITIGSPPENTRTLQRLQALFVNS